MEANQFQFTGLVPLLLLAVIVYWRYKTRHSRAAKKAEKKREKQWASENALPDVSSNLRVIVESIDIFRSSKNVDTATSRYTLAVDRLHELIRKYPHRTDWQELLDALQSEGREQLLLNLSTEIDKCLKKSSVAKSLAAKLTPLTKALQILNDAEDSGDFDDEWIAAKRTEVESIIHASELGKLMETAARFEFKEEWKKAVSAYQDALFFLKNDAIPDDEQESLINSIERKIADLKTR
jgi:hypothetical protein